jgi:predicted nucleotide-binding protein (sugar kinase/HSP70/actin superfamily)
MGHIAEPVSFEALRLPFKGGFMPFGRLFSFEMPSPVRWCTFSKIYQKILALDKARYAGIIHISTYNCGPDSIMTELYRNLCRKLSIPCLILMLDEHTASAGIETRLEAFADSLEWGLQNG